MKRFISVLLLTLAALVSCRDLSLAQRPLIFAALTDEGNLAVVDPVKSKLLERIQVGRTPVHVVLNADNSKIFVANTGEISVSVVSVAESKVTQVLRLPVNRRGIYTGVMIRSNDGKRLYVAERGDDENADLRVYVIDTEKDAIIGQFDAGRRISAMAIAADGKKIYVVNEGIGVMAYDPDNFQGMGAVKLPEGLATKVVGMACSPVKDLAYITFGDANKILALGTADGKTIAIIDMPKYKTGVQKDVFFTPDGKYALVLNTKKDLKDIDGVCVVDAVKNEVPKIFNAGVVRRGIAFTPDSKVAYIASADLKWYDLTTLEHIRSISLRTTLGGIVVLP